MDTFFARNPLDEKNDHQQPLVFDPQALANAESGLAKLRAKYADWVRDDINDLVSNCHDQFGKEELARVRRTAHNLKGQGESFGYPLISVIGQSLYEHCENLRVPGPGDPAIVRAHADAMLKVVEQGLTGKGDKTCSDIMLELARVRD